MNEETMYWLSGIAFSIVGLYLLESTHFASGAVSFIFGLTNLGFSIYASVKTAADNSNAKE